MIILSSDPINTCFLSLDNAKAFDKFVLKYSIKDKWALNLGENEIGDDGARSLASAFERNTTWPLQTLSLSENKIGPDGGHKHLM